MAQMLYPRDSSHRHMDATRRHLRLCKQIKNTQALVKQITPDYDLLSQKEQAYQEKQVLRQDRYDDMLLADNQLDDSVRNLFGRCQEHDRTNLGENILMQVFPEGTFSQIVTMNREEEPAEVEKLALRLENLGEKHPLYPFAAELRKKIAFSRKAIQIYQESLQVVKIAETECEMARAALRRQYEINYLDARKLMGKVMAERLFPKLNITHRSDKTVSNA